MKKITLILITLFVTFGLLQMVKAEEATVTFSNDNFVCSAGGSFSTLVKATGGDSVAAINRWGSSDESIVTVELHPYLQTNCIDCRLLLVTCKKEGSVTLTAFAGTSTTPGTATVESRITGNRIVFDPYPGEPGITHALSNEKGTIPLALNGIPSSEKDNVAFSIFPTDVASISKVEAGSDNTIDVEINYLKTGTATIFATLTYDGIVYADSYEFTIKNSMWTLELLKEDNSAIDDEYMICPDEIQLKASARYGLLAPHDVTEEATWTSSDESIFTVNKGLVKRVGDGNATITVTLGADKGSETKSITMMSQGAVMPIQDPIGKFTLTYDDNGGTGCGHLIEKVHTSSIVELCTPTREGYTFNGWFTAKTGGTKITSETKITSDITVYAQWKKIPTNPNTGIETPVIGLIGILILSLCGYLIIKNKSKSLQ